LGHVSVCIFSYINEETTYVTPFAQILANLYRVRSQFIALTDPPIPADRRKSGLWDPPPTCDGSFDDYKSLALSTLDELDWCLHKLETINSGKTMGTMAQDKFKRLLSRELSHMSERSRSGDMVAKWVNTLAGVTQDQIEDIDKTLDNMSVVESTLDIDNVKSRSTSISDSSRDKFGIVISESSDDALQKFFEVNIGKWEFNAVQLNDLTVGRPLVALAYNLFSERNLFFELKLSKNAFLKFMTTIESAYWKKNPYHNSIHAADVLHCVNYLLNASALENIFTPLEEMSVMIAACVHDVDHPGRNNQFLVNTMHDLAIMYNDESVLENHHLAVTFKLLQDQSCNFLENMDKSQTKVFRRIVIDTVLATDMSKHFKHLGELKTMVETKKVANDGILQVDKYSERSEILQCLLHCADLNNPAKPFDIAEEWAMRIVEENMMQGDEEKALQIEVSPLGDRNNICVPKCQVSFIDFIIYPLWETWAELVYPDAQIILDHLAHTRDQWYQMGLKVQSPSPETPDNDDSETSSVTTVAAVGSPTSTSIASTTTGSLDTVEILSPDGRMKRGIFKAKRDGAVESDK
jgi:cAMP-specific phosphodiesterase 4